MLYSELQLGLDSPNRYYGHVFKAPDLRALVPVDAAYENALL